jgi:hypothetical protein
MKLAHGMGNSSAAKQSEAKPLIMNTILRQTLRLVLIDWVV